MGVDNIDVTAATRRGIVVMNTPGGNTISTAEHTMALLLALARNVAKADASLKSGKWDRNKFTGTQLEGKTLGVIGLGRVGLAVARRAQGFGMTVLGFDPFLAAERALELGIESVARLDDIWPRCDFLTLHTPMTAETRNLIGAAEIAQMKPSVRIINCARGGLIDEAALAEALDSGKVAGAAIDVFDPEPPPAGHPLVGHPLVLVTPHLGASTEEAQVSVAVEAARLLCEFFGRGQVRFSVNMPTLDRAELEDLRLYLNLAWRLGMLHAQMDRGTLKSARVIYRGEVAHKNTRLITAAFAAGLMESALEEQVNLVNAMALARERGIIIEERRGRGARRLRHPGPDRGLHRAQDICRLRDPVRQAVPPPGPAGLLPARRPHRRDASGLHPHGPPRPDRFHRPDPRRRGGQHRPDERRPRGARGRGHRRRQPRQRPHGQSPRGRPGTPRHPERQRHQAPGPGRRAYLAGGLSCRQWSLGGGNSVKGEDVDAL